jgi:hypothetical protein
VFGWQHTQADRAQCVVVGVRIAQTHLVQPHRDRLDRPRIGRRVQLVHIGNAAQPFQHARKRPPTDQRGAHHGDNGESEHEPLPVIQRSGNETRETTGNLLQVRHPRQDCRDSVRRGGDSVERQLPKLRQDSKCDNHHNPDDGTGANRRRDHGCHATVMPLHDSSQPTDEGAERDSTETAQADYQEPDHTGGDRRGDHNAGPVPIGQQAHRHAAKQPEPPGVREDDRNDRCRRAQGAHHRRLSQFVRP